MTSRTSPTKFHPVSLLVMICLLAGFGLVYWQRSHRQAPVEPPVQATPGPQATGTAGTPLELPLPDRVPDGVLVLSDSERGIPGETETDWIFFRAPGAKQVKIAGAWDAWEGREEMKRMADGTWAWQLGGRGITFGRYEFKFVVDGTWEGGANRLVHLNDAGRIRRPPDVVAQSLIEGPHHLRLTLKQVPLDRARVVVDMKPYLGEPELDWKVREYDSRVNGFRLDGDEVEFMFVPGSYGLTDDKVHQVNLAGVFTGWNPSDSRYSMQRQANGFWTLRLPLAFVETKSAGQSLIFFKFVVNGDRWMQPPSDATNAAREPGTDHMNLVLNVEDGIRPELWIKVPHAIELSNPPVLTVKELADETIRLRPTPGRILDTFKSRKKLGALLDKEQNQTTYRLFAPRAVQVQLALYDSPFYQVETRGKIEPVPARERIPMTRDADGVWEVVRPSLDVGQYYSFNVFGPAGDSEGFNAGSQAADPYAAAMAHAEGNSIVMDLEADTPWFSGWDESTRFKRPEWQDMIIYETHVRDFSHHESSGVPGDLRGSYAGVLASRGTGTGLDYLKEMGVNTIEFMPIHEFPNGTTNRYDWGYATGFFFAPEAGYAQEPEQGSQVYEFKHLVNELQKEGFAVFLDVVYNHIGGVNVFNLIDRKYYFRLNPDLTNVNFSGCGNDVASERTMMRRLIVESVLYWVEEYHVDGFRFDLAELIDMDTLRLIEQEVRAKHPHVVLISEPWSFRGGHKDKLTDTGWAAWNDQFREPAKRFITGQGDKAALKRAIKGSTDSWTRHPLQSVNYLASHDDHALVDELTQQPGKDGRILTERDEGVHKLAATLLFTSLGMPMVTEGQMFLQSKHGVHNTYNRGDALNELIWTHRDRPHAREVMTYYKQVIALRQSPEGKAFRTTHTPAWDYVRFVDHPDETALGYFMNANRQERAPVFLVLFNAGEQPTSFTVDLPAGNWGRVGDGSSVDVAGLPGTTTIAGDRTLTLNVPAQTAMIYRDGF